MKSEKSKIDIAYKNEVILSAAVIREVKQLKSKLEHQKNMYEKEIRQLKCLYGGKSSIQKTPTGRRYSLQKTETELKFLDLKAGKGLKLKVNGNLRKKR